MHRIAVLLLPPVVGFDAAIAPTLFSIAADADGNALYDVVTCGLAPGPIAATTGFDLLPAAGPEVLATADTVVIPGTRYPPARIDGVLAPEASDALARIRSGTRLVSICTGAFVLAAAGLLDGRPATTHWKFADSMRRLHPQVLLDENVLFVDDGDLLTSAGLAAGIDLCLHIIRSDHGAQVANAVARYCVVPPWREGGQAQFIDRQVPAPDHFSTAATRRGSRPACGCATAASIAPASCWSRAICPSTRSPGWPASDRAGTCATTCVAVSGCRRRAIARCTRAPSRQAARRPPRSPGRRRSR
jgi:transcriptional regulator GlxA family with amidase domain